MSLADEYSRQFGWRDWATILDSLPPLAGHTVLDLGCGVGDQAAELTARGARVIGVDMNEELLREAGSRNLANADFHYADLRSLPEFGVAFDGLWCSFAAAYFTDLQTALAVWTKHLKPGGWVALTEIDDLFGHEPLGDRAKELFEAYAREALAAGRHDFHMGRKLRGHLERAGFTIRKAQTVTDKELSFDGPASPDVLEAWRNRFDRMKLLQDACGADFARLKADFLACLTRADHRSIAKVYFCIATKRKRS